MDTSRSSRPRRWIAALAIVMAVLGLVVAGLFAGRLLRRPRFFPPPRQTDVTLIAPWMTVPYVARGFGVPPGEIERALGVAGPGSDRRSLAELATATGRTPDAVVATVRETVQRWQASHRPPGSAAPGDDAAPRGPPPADRPGGGA